MNAILNNASVKRRDKLVIIAEILAIARTRALKTQIMYKANLSFSQLNEYLKLLTKVKLLEKKVESGKEIYRATKKGKEFLQRQQEVMDLLCEDTETRTQPRISYENFLKKN
jgi:predicted transcriptional regulator